jgi:phosphatidylinositol alpha-1,6-mannosyltransferase
MESRPKLIVISHEFAPFHGGAATYASEMARSLAKYRWNIEVWAPDYNQSQNALKAEAADGYTVKRFKSGGSLYFWHLITFGIGIFRRRKELEDAVVLLSSVGAQMIFIIFHCLGLLGTQKTYCLFHGSEILRFQKNFCWKNFAINFFKSVDGFIVSSEFTKTLFEESCFGSIKDRVVVAPCACSSEAALSIVKNETSEKLKSDSVRILTLARIHPRKGHLDTVEALTKLEPELRKRIIYQIAGKGDLAILKKVTEMSEKAGIAFQFLGEVKSEDLPSIYRQCDIYVLTSKRLEKSVEGFGITYLEASYNGKPIVAYETGGVSEAVVSEKSGILVEENNLTDLRDAIKRLICDAELRKRFGEFGKEYAKSFSWDRTAEIVSRFLLQRN